MEAARVEQLEIDSAQVRFVDLGQWRALSLRISHESHACLARSVDKDVGIRADRARDQDRAGDLAIEWLDIGAEASGICLVLVRPAPLSGLVGLTVLEILVASGREPAEI